MTAAAAADRFDLEGRVVLVTGASRGLGRAMVHGFAQAGADVVIASRKLDACQAVADEVERETGRRALPYACHVAYWDQIDELVEASWGHFGKVDVAVNNAGMSPLFGDDLNDVTEEYWDKVVGVNFKGPFRLCVAAGTRMAAGEGGSIINVSTVGSLSPTPHDLPYAAAKAGLNAMTLGLARAFGPTVRVNCLMPGPFYTDASAAWRESFEQTAPQTVPLGRGGEPDEVVGAALYFASDASSFTTGATLRVDGGVSI